MSENRVRVRMPSPEQIAKAGEILARWESVPAPCGIPHDHPYNPCMPEEDERGLWCINPACGLRQVPDG